VECLLLVEVGECLLLVEELGPLQVEVEEELFPLVEGVVQLLWEEELILLL